jgi:oxysterol-binding protein 1
VKCVSGLISGVDDAGSACRGAINMRIAKLHMDSQDKTRFEIHGKSSVKYHLKANHIVEAKRWFWALNNAIQWAKDEEKEEEKRRARSAEVLRQAKIEQTEGRSPENQAESTASSSSRTNGKGLSQPSVLRPSNNSISKLSVQTSRTAVESAPVDDEGSAYGSYDPSILQNEVNRAASHVTMGPDGDGDFEEYADGASSHDVQPVNKDAFNITAQSAKLQLDLLASISSSLQAEKATKPDLTISEPAVDRALAAYESAVRSLNGLLADLLKISRDRDAYWQFRLDREADARRMWEESMARIVQEHEELQNRMGESEDKRKRTKRALKEVLENTSTNESRPISRVVSNTLADASLNREDAVNDPPVRDVDVVDGCSIKNERAKQSNVSHFADLSESESDDEEFFDAVDAEEVEVANPDFQKEDLKMDIKSDLRAEKWAEVVSSFKGYEDPPRQKLKINFDNRPKISLWVSSQISMNLL